MIFHRRDADSKQFMYLAITEFVYPVHQENAPRLWRHGVNRSFIKPQQIGRFEVPLLRGGGDRIAVFAQRKEDRGRRLLASRAVDQEILGDATKKSARIDKLVALRAARRAREDFLHKVRRFLGSGLAAQEMKKRRAMRPIDGVQVVPGSRPLIGRRRAIVGMRMAGRRHRKGVAGRRTIVAGTGRHDRVSRRREREQPVVTGCPSPSAVPPFGRSRDPWSGWAAGPFGDWRI